VIDPLSEEVNPLHASVIDSPGHRYRVEDTLTSAISLGVRVLL
jgi:translation elongation factor EF-1alpha